MNIIIGLYIGSVIGYIIGLKIWDLYYDKFILPEIEQQDKLKFESRLKMANIIGNPKNVKIY